MKNRIKLLFVIQFSSFFFLVSNGWTQNLSLNQERWLEWRAQSLAKKERTNEAIALYKELLTVSPDNPSYLLQLAQLYTQERNYQEAIQLLNQALATSPDDLDIRLKLAFNYLYNNELRKSEDLFESILEDSPSYADAWAGLGRVETLKGNTQTAQSLFQQSLNIDPSNELAQAYLTQLHSFQGKGGELTEEQEQEIQADQYEANQNYQQAIDIYQALVKKFPKKSDYWLRLGEIYQKNNDNKKAIEAVRTSLKLSPNDLDIKLKLAYLYLFDHQLNKSERLFQEIVDEMKDYEEALVGLGRVKALKGQGDEAERHYRKALSLNPYNQTARQYLQQLQSSESVE